MSESLKAIRIIQFDDKKSSFRRWSKKFLAVANRRGYKKILLGTEQVPNSTDVLDESDPLQKELLLAREANELAYNDLILACDGDVAFSIVETSISTDLPDGDAKVAWKNLHTKFMPQTSANKVQLMAKFANSSLKSWKKDPDEWINDLEILRSRIKDCGHAINDDDLIIHILNNLPEKYDNLVENLEAKMDVTNPLTLEELRESLSLKFTKWKVRAEKNGMDGFDAESDEEENSEEIALVAGGFKKPFKGRCNVCGRFGHKAVDCPTKNKKENKGNNGDKGRFNGKCYYCGKWGHMKQDCKKLKADRAAKSANVMIAEEDDDEEHVYVTCEVIEDQPEQFSIAEEEVEYWADEMEIAEENETENEEYVCMACDVIENWWEKMNTLLLSDEPRTAKEHIWLIDSGASSHISNRIEGMKNLRPIEKKSKSEVGSTLLRHTSVIYLVKSCQRKEKELRSV